MDLNLKLSSTVRESENRGTPDAHHRLLDREYLDNSAESAPPF